MDGLGICAGHRIRFVPSSAVSTGIGPGSRVRWKGFSETQSGKLPPFAGLRIPPEECLALAREFAPRTFDDRVYFAFFAVAKISLVPHVRNGLCIRTEDEWRDKKIRATFGK